MAWLPYKSRAAFEGKPFAAVPRGPRTQTQGSPLDLGIERLVSAGQLHQTERLLHVGWMWLAGTVEQDGESVRYCFPLLSVPVGPVDDTVDSARELVSALRTSWSAASNGVLESRILRALGDAEITPLITDDEIRWELEDSVEFSGVIEEPADGLLGKAVQAVEGTRREHHPGLGSRAWCRRGASTIGLTIDEWLRAEQALPTERAKQPGIAAIVGYGLYLNQAPASGTKRGDLLSLAVLPGVERSALSALYLEDFDGPNGSADTVALRPLSARQREIATRAAASPIAAVSGAPGTGKTHVLSVIAMSAVARGESVLVVGSSEHSVDVLLGHLAQTPGPPAVTFGGSNHSGRLAAELRDLLASEKQESEFRDLPDFIERRASVERLLAIELEAIRQDGDPSHRIERTAELDRAGDFDELRDLLHEVENPGPLTFFTRGKRKKLQKRLGVDDIAAAEDRLNELIAARDARRLLASGGVTVTRNLEGLVTADDRAAQDRGAVIAQHWLDRLERSDRTVLNEIAHAMTVSRSQRRRVLRGRKAAELVQAAPLWVSAANDVDDMLPPVAQLFDMVILDEAAQMTQANAAAALVRGKRAIICGDPRQLNQTSFLSNDDLQAATSMFNTDPVLLDLRANSILDVAAMRAPAQRLEEHFRSAPHLIEFSSRRFYDGNLDVATRHPSNEAADHIHIELVPDGTRGGSSKKPNEAEVERCLQVAKRYIDQGCTSIGFMSPFRTQADALEAAILDTYRLEQIDRYGLRVGTVHGFQGDERDVVILSWAVGPDEGVGAWRFVNMPNLFNVMVTRAREQVVVVTSVEEPPGLAGDYLGWSDPLEDLVADVDSGDRWVNRVAEAVREQGLPVRVGYRVGKHVVDIVVGDGEAAVAVECGPHPDGVEAHLDRAGLLQRTGWRTVDAFKSKWDANPGQFAIELASEYPDLRS